MTTVDKKLANNIASHGGWYNGDSDNSMGDNPQVIRIWKYENMFGGTSYKLIMEDRGVRDAYYDGKELLNSELYWDLKS